MHARWLSKRLLRISTYYLFVFWRFTMVKKTFTSLFAVLFLAGTMAAISGCNTVEGAGKDIEKGGAAIKNKANEEKK